MYSFKNVSVLFCCLLIPCLVFTTCNDDDNNSTGPSTPRGIIIEDEIEEELPGFVDITSIEYYIDSTIIIITFNLRALPPTLTFNSPDLEDGIWEYEWAAKFYIISSNDYQMALFNYKEMGWEEEETTGPILQNCKADLIEWSGNSGSHVRNIEAKIYPNQIRLSVNKSILATLSQITPECKIDFVARYNNGIDHWSDEVNKY